MHPFNYSTVSCDYDSTNESGRLITMSPRNRYLFHFISFHFIIFKHKTLSAKKKKRETIQMSIYIYIKSYNFAGLPRDRASGRMLIL